MSYTGGAILIAVAVPVIFFLFVWVVVTVSRILFPEKPVPFVIRYKIGRCFGRSQKLEGITGAHQIRARLRTRLKEQEHAATTYERGLPGSIPDAWKDELWERRN